MRTPAAAGSAGEACTAFGAKFGRANCGWGPEGDVAMPATPTQNIESVRTTRVRFIRNLVHDTDPTGANRRNQGLTVLRSGEVLANYEVAKPKQDERIDESIPRIKRLCKRWFYSLGHAIRGSRNYCRRGRFFNTDICLLTRDSTPLRARSIIFFSCSSSNGCCSAVA